MEVNTILNEVMTKHMMLFALFVVWTLIWKGLALWQAGTKRDKIWFIIILVLNTGGIFDIVYFFLISKRNSLKPKAKVIKEKEE